jgi:signal transduction histidine kinase
MSTVPDRPRVLRVATGLDERAVVLMSIEDTGTGIDPGHIERVFDPFFTTKARGMGMGLSICRSIVAAHGGRLWVSPGNPHGTVFHVGLPSAAAATGDPRS